MDTINPTLSCDSIQRNPSLATEENLASLLKSLIKVHVSEGREQGGYDYNLQSYYDQCYSVSRNDAAFNAITEIAKSNPAAMSDTNRQLLKEIGKRDIRYQVTSSSLHAETSYSDDLDSCKSAEEDRSRILNDLEELFATE